MDVVGPEDHAPLGSDLLAEPDRVLRHGFVAQLLSGRSQVVLEGDAEGLQGDRERLLAGGGFVFRPSGHEELPRLLHRGAALRPIGVRLVVVHRVRPPATVVVGETGQAVEFFGHQRLAGGVHRTEVLTDEVQRHPRILHVHSVETDVATGLVVGAHPLDHLEHRLRVPGPEVEPGEQLLRIPFPGADIVVYPPRLRPSGFHGEGVEAHLLHQEPEDAGLHLEAVPRSVRVLAERDDPRVSHHIAQEFHTLGRPVEVGARERMNIRVQPVLHLVRNGDRRRRRRVRRLRRQRGGRGRRVSPATGPERQRADQGHDGTEPSRERLHSRWPFPDSECTALVGARNIHRQSRSGTPTGREASRRRRPKRHRKGREGAEFPAVRPAAEPVIGVGGRPVRAHRCPLRVGRLAPPRFQPAARPECCEGPAVQDNPCAPTL